MNAAWHRAHPFPRRSADAERLRWHLAHRDACGCRPIPPKLAALAAEKNGPAQPLELRPIRPTDWPAVEQLFGANGACDGCWCMYWRASTTAEFHAVKGEPAKQAFRTLVEGGEARGILAFEGERAVGWCALGPRADFPLTETKRSYVVKDAPAVWSVNCFFIHRDRRRRGIARRLLDAAVAEARAAGAHTLEGYPWPLPPRRHPPQLQGHPLDVRGRRLPHRAAPLPEQSPRAPHPPYPPSRVSRTREGWRTIAQMHHRDHAPATKGLGRPRS